jgi:hypothetical protein
MTIACLCGGLIEISALLLWSLLALVAAIFPSLRRRWRNGRWLNLAERRCGRCNNDHSDSNCWNKE